MTRLRYDNDYGTNYASLGLFCRMPTLSSTFTQSLRFGYNGAGVLCKFNKASSWTATSNMLTTHSTGEVTSSACGYSTGSDFYLTFVYTAYDDTNTTDYEE